MTEPFVVAIDETVILCFWLSLITVVNGLIVSPLMWAISQEINTIAVVPARRKRLVRGVVLVSTLTLILNMLIMFRLVDLIKYQGWSF